MRNYKSTIIVQNNMEELTFNEKLEALRKLKGSSPNKHFLSKKELSKIIRKEYGLE